MGRGARSGGAACGDERSEGELGEPLELSIKEADCDAGVERVLRAEFVLAADDTDATAVLEPDTAGMRYIPLPSCAANSQPDVP